MLLTPAGMAIQPRDNVRERAASLMRRTLVAFSLLACVPPMARAAEPIEVGSRRELFVDDFLIEQMDGAELRLHQPVPREVAIVHDEPWEGNSCGYHTIFRDGDLYRMYYKAVSQVLKGEPASHGVLACYAESTDGIHWKKPALGQFEFQGSRKNNIVWDGLGAHDFTPFKDPNPDCSPDAAYKAVGNAAGGEPLEGFSGRVLRG